MKLSLQFFAGDPPSDYPDLNKCPDCETYFAQLHCPLCGKECPPEMRAGNRARNKKPVRDPYSRGSGRVSFVPWYLTTPFILIMLAVQPLIGMILMWMGHWKKKWKIAVTVGAVLIAVLPYLIIFGITLLGSGNQDAPVDLSLSREEYVAACETVDPSAFYRDPWGCEGDFLSFDVEIVGVHYAVEDLGGREKFYTAHVKVGDSSAVILLWDYQPEGEGLNFVPGDRVTVYGQSAGMKPLETEATSFDAACLGLRYARLAEPDA